MQDKSQRRELKAEYRESRPEAGVYRITNTQNGKVLVSSTANLGSLRNKMEFAKSTNSATVLDLRLAADIRQFGIHAFSFEVLEVVQVKPDAPRDSVLRDLATLEELWREKLGAESGY